MPTNSRGAVFENKQVMSAGVSQQRSVVAEAKYVWLKGQGNQQLVLARGHAKENLVG